MESEAFGWKSEAFGWKSEAFGWKAKRTILIGGLPVIAQGQKIYRWKALDSAHLPRAFTSL